MNHRWEAGDHQSVLRLATQQWFRDQFLALRPAEAIEEDIKLALRSAAARRDPVAFARVILAGSELSQRRYNIETVDMVDLLIDVQRREEAVQHLRVGNRLLVPASVALEVSGKLQALGMSEEARRIFELAEPLDLFSGHPVEEVGLVEDRDELLLSWARTAPRFRPLNDVIEQIRRVRLGESRRWQMRADAATRYMQGQMLFATGLALLDANRTNQLERVLAELADDETSAPTSWAWLHVHSWRHLVHRDTDTPRQLVENVLEHVDELPLDDELSTHIAEATYRVLGDGDRARQLIRGVVQPTLGTDVPSTDADMDPFWQWFRLNRLLIALSEGVPPDQAVPEPARPGERGLVIFERTVCALARMWGRHWRGDHPDVQAFAYEAGRLTVHTVWWRQGQPNAWGYSRDEVGEGWLVLALPEAISTMKATLGDLRRAVVVERSLGEGDEAPRVASRCEDA